jgi:hypothetical protein
MKAVLLCWLLVAGAVLACQIPVFRLLLGACRTLNRSEKVSRVNPWVHALFL